MIRGTAAVLVAFVLLAGCGSVASPGGDVTPTRTITPVPVPQETPTPRGPAVLAPGLSAEGVFDATELADAHAATLSATSFTAVRVERRHRADGSLVSRYRSVVRMSAAGDRFRYGLNQTDVRDGRVRNQSLARYADGSQVYVATTRSGETTYSVLGDPGEPTDPSTVFRENATERVGVVRLFGSLRLDVVDRRTVDGRTVYRVAVENGSQQFGTLRNVSLNATIREDGLVTAYRLSYEIGSLRVAVAVDFRDVGGTEVTPPSWLPAARNATGTATATPATVRTSGATANGTARSTAWPTGRLTS
jgi:hypothetical protein